MQHKLLPRVVKPSEIWHNTKRERGTEIDRERDGGRKRGIGSGSDCGSTINSTLCSMTKDKAKLRFA